MCINSMIASSADKHLNIDNGGTKTILGPAATLRAPTGKNNGLNFYLLLLFTDISPACHLEKQS